MFAMGNATAYFLGTALLGGPLIVIGSCIGAQDSDKLGKGSTKKRFFLMVAIAWIHCMTEVSGLPPFSIYWMGIPCHLSENKKGIESPEFPSVEGFCL